MNIQYLIYTAAAEVKYMQLESEVYMFGGVKLISGLVDFHNES